MATVFRDPLGAYRSQRWPLEATLGWTYRGPSLISAVVRPVGSALVEPVRFTSSPWVAINSQASIDASSKLLYLKSNPITRSVADLPLVPGRLQPDQTKSALSLLSGTVAPSLPTGKPSYDLRLVAGQPQPWIWPSSQELYLVSGPIGVQSYDVRLTAGQPPQAWTWPSSQELFLTSNPIGVQSFDVRLTASPWQAIGSQQNIEASSLLLSLFSNPISVPAVDQTRTSPRQADQTSLGSPAILLQPIGLPPGLQSLDLRVQPNPWIAVGSQLGIVVPGINLVPPPPVVALPPGLRALEVRLAWDPWVSINSQEFVTFPGINLVPPPVASDSEYIYYAHHKGIR